VVAWTSTAARNNADWCDALCRTHGARTTLDEVAWTSRTRTPPFYPDAVTLVPEPDVPSLLARIDNAAGCSIKDSFATLDLTAHGYQVLLEAEWIVRTSTGPQPAVAGPRWDTVQDVDDLATWEQAWRGHDDGSSGLFRAELLDNDAVAMLGARSAAGVVAGAVLYRSSDAVGISNFFTTPTAPANTWASCLAFAETLFPGSTLVSYASGRALAAARDHNFAPAGPLRVWLRKCAREGCHPRDACLPRRSPSSLGGRTLGMPTFTVLA
jgi:hypothetical protein